MSKEIIVAGLDLETTGLSVEDGHKIIEVGIILNRFDGKDAHFLDKYIRRINPGRSIQPAAEAVHGISYAQVAHEPMFEHFAPDISRLLSESDLLVGHNIIGFDAPFLIAELVAAKQPIPTPQVVDTADARWATPQGKVPKLGELCYALDIPYDPTLAHAAEYDIERTLDAFFAGLRLGFFKLPEGLL